MPLLDVELLSERREHGTLKSGTQTFQLNLEGPLVPPAEAKQEVLTLVLNIGNITNTKDPYIGFRVAVVAVLTEQISFFEDFFGHTNDRLKGKRFISNVDVLTGFG